MREEKIGSFDLDQKMQNLDLLPASKRRKVITHSWI